MSMACENILNVSLGPIINTNSDVMAGFAENL
jgi:hypothetical protein